MDDSEMRVWVGSWVGLCELGPLAQQIGHELLSKGLVSSLGEERLFLKDGKECHGLLKHVNTFLKIHAKVNIGPVKTFFDILFLLKGEHMLIEELLQLFIDIIDTDLLKAIVIENLKASNVKHTNVGDLLHGRVAESLVTLLYNDSETTLIDSTSNASNRVGSILTGGHLLDPLSTDLQLGLTEVGDHPFTVNSKELSNLFSIGRVLNLSLLFFAYGYKVLGHVTHVHHDSSVLEHVIFFRIAEAKSVKGFICELHVFLVIDRGYSELALGDVPVV